MKCPDPHCACISHEINEEREPMTSERADNKCEKCGVKLFPPATDAAFEDIIVCPSCVGVDSSNLTEYYIYDNESFK